MNAVAREFWTEVLDLRTPIHDDARPRGERARGKGKQGRRAQVRKSVRLEKAS